MAIVLSCDSLVKTIGNEKPLITFELFMILAKYALYITCSYNVFQRPALERNYQY